MRPAFILGLPLMLSASPALATGGFDCRTADRRIVLTGSFGNSVGTPIDAVFLDVGGRTLATAGDAPHYTIVRSWLDVCDIRIDLVPRDADRITVQLRARLGAPGPETGTLLLDGVTHPVRCELERMDL
ncbi:MAG: hypothetical protein ACXWUX_06150 [Allosphingosinicella sp.]